MWRTAKNNNNANNAQNNGDQERERDEDGNKKIEEERERETETIMDLAKAGLDLVLEHLELQYKLEQVALLGFSSDISTFVNFQRDIKDIRHRLSSVDVADSTNILMAIRSIIGLVRDQWVR